jgi:hypothetical protein
MTAPKIIAGLVPMAEAPLRELMPLKTVKSPVSQSGAGLFFISKILRISKVEACIQVCSGTNRTCGQLWEEGLPTSLKFLGLVGC